MTPMAMRRTVRMAIATAAIGISLGFATPAGATQKGEDFPGGEAKFKQECTDSGGRFYRDSESGAIRCRYDNGTIIMCDRGAKNCTTHTPARFPSGSAAVYQGRGDVAAR